MASGELIPGQRLRGLPARPWNAMVAHLRAAPEQGGGVPGLGAGLVQIRNGSGADLWRFGVLAVTGTLYELKNAGGDADWAVADATAASVGEFTNKWCLNGGAPTGDPAELLAIAIEPIAQNKIGRARLAGTASPARVFFRHIEHTYVEADPTSTARLRSRPWYGGEGVIRTPVYGCVDTDLAWALVDRKLPALSIGYAKIAAHAYAPWYHYGPAGPRCNEQHWTHANPCRDRLGTDVDVTTDLSVLLHVDSLVVAGQCGARDPNLVVGDVIQVLQVPGQVSVYPDDPASGVLYVCISDILDDALGTVKMWCGNSVTTDQIPRGWSRLQEVVGDGLPDGSVPAYNDDYTTWKTKVTGPAAGGVNDPPKVYLMFIVRVV